VFIADVGSSGESRRTVYLDHLCVGGNRSSGDCCGDEYISEYRIHHFQVCGATCGMIAVSCVVERGLMFIFASVYFYGASED